MPIYEYRCESCGYELEAMQKISDAPLTECPECGAPRLRKLISAAGFRLKGGGWYETDFKKGGSKKNLHGAHEDKPKTGTAKESGTKDKKTGGAAASSAGGS